MADPIRISSQGVREKVVDGAALLVCAYEDEEKFRQMHLDGAFSRPCSANLLFFSVFAYR